jgi:acetyl esterase
MFVAALSLTLAGCGTALSPSASPKATQEPRKYIYREIGGQALPAYVFFPGGERNRTPTSAILLFHGGGWSVGSADWTFASARRFAGLGMVAISIEYRLSQGDITQMSLLECHGAIRCKRLIIQTEVPRLSRCSHR